MFQRNAAQPCNWFEPVLYEICLNRIGIAFYTQKY